MGEKLASLGIDLWSIIFYLGNIGITLVVLIWLTYKPISRFLEQRKQQINNSIDEAKNLQIEFEKKLDKSEKDRIETESKLRHELAELQKFTDRKRAELLSEIEETKKEMIQKAQVEIDKKKEGIIKDAENEVKALMVKIILDIVENKVPANVISESMDSAWKKFSK